MRACAYVRAGAYRSVRARACVRGQGQTIGDTRGGTMLLAAIVSNAKILADNDPITLAAAYELSQFNYFQRTTCDTLHALPTRLFV